jgi:hypothetical protein
MVWFMSATCRFIGTCITLWHKWHVGWPLTWRSALRTSMKGWCRFDNHLWRYYYLHHQIDSKCVIAVFTDAIMEVALHLTAKHWRSVS